MTVRHLKYKSELRAEGMERTRERILAAVMDHLAADAGPITLRAIARRAKVATPTVIRHFRDRDALLEAFWDWAAPRLGTPSVQPKAEEAPLWPRKLFAIMDQYPGFFRALVLTPEGRAMRKMRFGRRTEMAVRAFSPLVKELSPAAQKRTLVLLRMLVAGVNIWLEMREQYGLPGEESGKAVGWLLGVALNELRKNPRGVEGT